LCNSTQKIPENLTQKLLAIEHKGNNHRALNIKIK